MPIIVSNQLQVPSSLVSLESSPSSSSSLASWPDTVTNEIRRKRNKQYLGANLAIFWRWTVTADSDNIPGFGENYLVARAGMLGCGRDDQPPQSEEFTHCQFSVGDQVQVETPWFYIICSLDLIFLVFFRSWIKLESRRNFGGNSEFHYSSCFIRFWRVGR